MKVRQIWLVGLVVALGLSSGALARAAALLPEEETGKRIYFEGRGAGSPIVAYFGRDDVSMPAALLPCANCHGHDGLGRPEGGVEPPNITWRHLTKTYGHNHPNGREHGPFDEVSVVGAIAGGADPDGNALDPLMPRYDMEPADFKALVTFLKRLESDLDAGLSKTSIRVGTLLPRTGAHKAFGDAVEATIRAYFEDINVTGGVFGRKLELVIAEYAEDPQLTAANARSLLQEDGGVFAVLAAFALGVEREVFAAFEEVGVPQIDPFTLFAGHRDFPSERIFFLMSGLPDQARALVAYSLRHIAPPPERLAVVLPPAEIYDEVAWAVEDQARRSGRNSPPVLRLAGDAGDIAQAVTELRQAGTEAVYFFGDTAILTRLAYEAELRQWRPRIFLPGRTAGRAVFSLPAAFDGRVHLAFPNLLQDQSAAGITELRRLTAAHGLGNDHLATRVSAFAAAKVLVEGLRRSGRALNRARLGEALQGLSKYDTGLTPPISFGPSRHVGVRGAHVVSVDLQRRGFAPGQVWVGLD